MSDAYCLLHGAECTKPTQCLISMGGCAHPAAEKQRQQMHRRVAEDAKLRRDEMAEIRRRAEERDARRNQPITRGEILDAIDATRHAMGGNVGDAHDIATKMLDALREAFE